MAEHNPLKQKLLPQQFEAAVNFYDADKDLTVDDRNQIGEDLKQVIMKTAFVGYTSGVLGFFIPGLYNKYFGKPSTSGVPPGALFTAGGRPLPVSPMKRFVHRPFLSFITGLSVMMITNQLTCRYLFNKKREAITDNAKQLKIWQTMDYHQASLFFLYYRKSAENPSFIIKDPRSFTDDEIYYRPPPPSRNQHDHFTNALGIGYTKSPQEKGGELSHWDQIRVANGFEVSTPSNEPDQSQPKEYGDPRGADEPTGIEQKENAAPTSAWDSIRQHNDK